MVPSSSAPRNPSCSLGYDHAGWLPILPSQRADPLHLVSGPSLYFFRRHRLEKHCVPEARDPQSTVGPLCAWEFRQVGSIPLRIHNMHVPQATRNSGSPRLGWAKPAASHDAEDSWLNPQTSRADTLWHSAHTPSAHGRGRRVPFASF